MFTYLSVYTQKLLLAFASLIFFLRFVLFSAPLAQLVMLFCFHLSKILHKNGKKRGMSRTQKTKKYIKLPYYVHLKAQQEL
jgi:hypothetical protein